MEWHKETVDEKVLRKAGWPTGYWNSSNGNTCRIYLDRKTQKELLKKVEKEIKNEEK